MTNTNHVLITDGHLINVFDGSDTAQGYAPRKYLLTYGHEGLNTIETKTFNACNLKEAKLLASEYVLRFTRGKLQSVTFVGINNW
jgi:hypothetical protein